MRDLALHRLLFTLLPLFSFVSSTPPSPALLHAPPPSLPAVPTMLKVGLVLDMNSSMGMMSRTSINMSLSDFYAAHPNSTTRLLLLPRDLGSDVISVAAAGTPPSPPSTHHTPRDSGSGPDDQPGGARHHRPLEVLGHGLHGGPRHQGPGPHGLLLRHQPLVCAIANALLHPHRPQRCSPSQCPCRPRPGLRVRFKD